MNETALLTGTTGVDIAAQKQRPGAPTNPDAWLREMERAQLAQWFTHDAANPARATPVTGAAPAAGPGTSASTARPPERALAMSTPFGVAHQPSPGDVPPTQGSTGTGSEDLAGDARTSGTGKAPTDAHLAREVAPATASSLVNAVNQALTQAASAGTRGDSVRAVGPDGIATVPSPAAPPPSLTLLPPPGTRSPAPGLPEVASAEGVMPVTSDLPSVRLHAEWQGNDVTVWLGIDGDEATIAARLAVVVGELQQVLAAQGQRLRSLICNGNAILQDGRACANTGSGPAWPWQRPPEAFSHVFDQLYRQEA